MTELNFKVPEISCAHCKQTIERQVASLDGVQRVEVDIAAKRVTVEGGAARAAVIAAIDEAGYRVADA